jgi:hypothetical protein
MANEELTCYGGANDDGACTLAPSEESGSTMLCEDQNENCEMWSQSGECDNNPKHMNLNCRRSCGLCLDSSIDDGPNCKDHNESCNLWAGQGECAANPKYMEKNCRLSCMLCSEKV